MFYFYFIFKGNLGPWDTNYNLRFCVMGQLISNCYINQCDLLQCQNQNKGGCFLLVQMTNSYVGHTSKNNNL